MRLGVALLAAGASRRFGVEDKLAQSLGGNLLGEHAALSIPRDLFSRAFVITPNESHPCEPLWMAEGFEPRINPHAREGMGTSVALAAELAEDASLDALLIALADMPFVPTDHFTELAGASLSETEILVSATSDARMPPAVFGKAHFAALSKVSGDKGARDLLLRGKVIPCPAEWLTDIDTPDALTKAREQLRSQN